MGFEPMNTGFADQRVSHFAIGAHGNHRQDRPAGCHNAKLILGRFERLL
jgi:hypothetical protein